MKKSLLIIFVSLFSLCVSAQSYQQLSEQALDWVGKDSLRLAEKLFRQALKLEPANPHNALLFSNIGTIQRRQRKYEHAVESYTFALNFAPRAVPILLNRADTYMEMGVTDRAYIDYCEILDLDKAHKEALLMRAYIYVIRRDYKSARTDYNRLLELEAKNYNARLGLANLNQKQERYSEALEIINKMLVERPNDPVLYMTRAGIEQDMGHSDLALVDLDESIHLQPDYPQAYVARGEIYLSQKRKGLAKTDFEMAISLGVPYSDLKEELNKCK